MVPQEGKSSELRPSFLPAGPADPLRWALQALLLASSCAWVTAAALTCPELPPAPAGTRRFALSAGLLSQASPWQTLAYNDTRGWGPVLQVALGETMQVDVTNAGIEVRSRVAAAVPARTAS